ncbi:hypothetical protein V5799_022058 [Amblyomma americanum]|uniref:Uncharacterized protein n=1 Tax=Amblyomma americanum TaxID=6943 RepID=A0AAQ4FN67_AMBAM
MRRRKKLDTMSFHGKTTAQKSMRHLATIKGTGSACPEFLIMQIHTLDTMAQACLFALDDQTLPQTKDSGVSSNAMLWGVATTP